MIYTFVHGFRNLLLGRTKACLILSALIFASLMWSQPLDVNGQLSIEQKNFGGYAGLLVKGASPSTNWPNIGFSTQNTAGIDVIIGGVYSQIINNSPGSEAMDLVLMTAKNSVLAEHLRITNSGNVGTYPRMVQSARRRRAHRYSANASSFCSSLVFDGVELLVTTAIS